MNSLEILQSFTDEEKYGVSFTIISMAREIPSGREAETEMS